MKEIYISVCFTIQQGVAFARQIPYFFENTVMSVINQSNQNFTAIVYIPLKWKPHADPYLANPAYQKPNIQYSFESGQFRTNFSIPPKDPGSRLVFLYLIAGVQYPNTLVDTVFMTESPIRVMAYQTNQVYDLRRNQIYSQPETKKYFLGYCCGYDEYVRLYAVYNTLYEIWRYVDCNRVPSIVLPITPVHSI